MASVVRAAIGYLFLLFMMRIAGRRPGKQIEPFEFVLVFFMGGVTLTAMVGDDRSFTNAVIQIVAIAGTHALLTTLKLRFPALAKIVDGTPLVLLNKGDWNVTNMRRMRIQDDNVMAMARDQGLERLDQVEYAVLERNGEISIVPKESEK